MNRMCSPELECIVYSTTVVNKGGTISQREHEVFINKFCLSDQLAIWGKIYLELYFISHTKINFS